MADRLDLYFRAHTTPVTPIGEQPYSNQRAAEATDALIFRCLTTADEKQELLLGAYICAQQEGGVYVAKEIGLFSRDGHRDEFRILQRFVKDSTFEIGTAADFRRRVFLKYLKAEQLIAGYDMPREISRIAVKSNKSLKHKRAFSFYFRVFKDKKTGTVRPSGYEPGLSIESLDASKAIYRLIKYKFHDMDAEREEEQQASNVRVLDLKTVTAVFTGETYTFPTTCELFGIPASRTTKRHARVTKPAIESLLRDVTAELELLNRLTREFAPHGFDLPLDRVFSPATVAKHYLSAMGVKPPQDKFVIPDTINGIAMQSFFAGRAECNITRTPVGVTYVDLHAQFSAVSSSLACREILCAQSLEFPDFTAGARRMVEQTTLDDCARPEFWKRLRWYARVEANDAVLPMRAKFSKSENADPTLGWNFLTSKQPIWITGPDAIAAKLLGKPPKILEAIAVVPHGVQPGLTSIKLYGEIDVDPRRDDLAVKLVELRALLKKKNPRLAGGSKVSANSAAFGIFGQLDVKDLDLSTALNVSSGDAHYHILPDTIWEKPSEFYCPVIASLVTGGSHLLCAMLERAVRDRGGYIAAMDTDSAMIVSTKDGGLIPCAGGPDRLDEYHLASGHTAVRALSWAEVDQIREQFESLNPWRETLNTPFLKLEKENLAANGERRQLYAYCIAAKLYCLFNLDENGLVIRKPSGHGLGFLQAPYSIRDWEAKTRRKWDEGLPPYIFEAWHYIVSRALGLRYKSPAWLQQPAVMTVPITRPRVLEQLGRFKDKLRPFTVVMIPFPKKTLDLLWKGYFIMPYRDKLDDLGGRSMVNVVSGETFYIHDPASPAKPSPWWLSLETMRDEIDHILSRTESKFCTPNGSTCTSQTIGLLLRRHIVAGEFHYIGKEASTSWGSGPSLTMLAGADAVDAADKTYREYERVVDPKYLDEIRTAAKQFSTKRLSRQAKLAEGTIRKFKNGKNCIRPRTLRKLTRAIHDLANKYAQSIAGG